MHFLSSVLVGAICASTALAHIEMTYPFAIGSKYDRQNTQEEIDYDNPSPLKTDGSNYPCRGNHLNHRWRSVKNYTAGQTDTIKLAGIAHRGGSCQLSLSYDNGKTFKVIQSEMGGCPLTLQSKFQIPTFAPTGKALLGWTWFNYEGNREMYMNCAMIEITGGPEDTSKFNSLPEIFKANIGPKFNNCKTTEYKEVVFAHPGEVVRYGASQASGAQRPVTPQDPPSPICDGNQ
ncbi:hypothetical protein FQN57_001862 [Myotisia sp. PD_48]|nr:hypothetical protein FQN57_001862 [Myotisia sp. PD_48]